MKNLYSLAIAGLFVVSLVLSSCTTIYFKNGNASAGKKYTEWRHNAILGLIEISPAVDINKSCGKDWAWVKTEQSLVNGVVNYVTSNIYTPLTAEVACKK